MDHYTGDVEFKMIYEFNKEANKVFTGSTDIEFNEINGLFRNEIDKKDRVRGKFILNRHDLCPTTIE